MNKPIPNRDKTPRMREGRVSLAAKLRQARLKAAFAREEKRDPVLMALAQKGWTFRAKPRGTPHSLSTLQSKPNIIARRATPLGCLRIARRTSASAASASSAAGAAGTCVRRAPFSVHDLSRPLAIAAPNLAAAALIVLLLIVLV